MGDDIKSPLDLPGYAEALHRERFGRHAAFLDVHETIAGFTVRALTLQDFMALRVLESPLLYHQTPTPLDLAAFLWLLSPDYAPRNDAARKKVMKQCLGFMPPREGLVSLLLRRLFPPPPNRKQARNLAHAWLRFAGGLVRHWLTIPCRRHDRLREQRLARAAEVLVAARGYLRDALSDKPAAVEHEGIPSPDYYSDACALISLLAREKSFSESAVLRMPLKRVFQHVREIVDRHNRQALPLDRIPLGNPSDRVITEYLNGNPVNN